MTKSIAMLIQSATTANDAVLHAVAEKIVRIEGCQFSRAVEEVMLLCEADDCVFSQTHQNRTGKTFHYYGVPASVGTAILFEMHNRRAGRGRFLRAQDALGLWQVCVEEGTNWQEPAANVNLVHAQAKNCNGEDVRDLAWALLCVKDEDFDKALWDIIHVLGGPARGQKEKAVEKATGRAMSLHAQRAILAEMVRLGLDDGRRDDYLNIASGRLAEMVKDRGNAEPKGRGGAKPGGKN